MFEDAQGGSSDDSKKSARRTKRDDQPAASMPAVEKSTLGDIEELAALKEQLNQKAIDALKSKEDNAADAK